MIEVKEALNIPAQQFYQYILKSVEHDINDNVETPLTADQLVPGFEYVKQLRTKISTKGNVRVIIEKLELNHSYRARFSSNLGVNTLEYTIIPLSDRQCEVTYAEDYLSDSVLQRTNHRWLSKLYQKKDKKRMVRVLKAIEAYLLGSEGKND